jgi:hypothetical protein
VVCQDPVKTGNGFHHATNRKIAERQRAMLRKGNVPSVMNVRYRINASGNSLGYE